MSTFARNLGLLNPELATIKYSLQLSNYLLLSIVFHDTRTLLGVRILLADLVIKF